MFNHFQDFRSLDSESSLFAESDGQLGIFWNPQSLNSENLSFPPEYNQPPQKSTSADFNQGESTNIEIQDPQISSDVFGNVQQPESENTFAEIETKKKRKLALNLQFRHVRRKLEERKILRKHFKEENEDQDQNTKSRTGDQWTKNLLKVGKCSLSSFFKESKKGKAFLKDNEWLETMFKKATFYLEDFDVLYKNKNLEGILSEYFGKKILYRDLMNSRVTDKNRKRYMYYLDVFEENFKNREFTGISEPKQRIDKRKRQNK